MAFEEAYFRGRLTLPRRPALAWWICAIVGWAWLPAVCPAAAPRAPASGPAATQTGDAESAATLIIKVVGQSDPAVRRDAAMAMLESGSAESIKALLGVFEVENNEQAKVAVCDAIAATKSQVPEFIPPLESLLRHKNPALRKAGAAALASYTDPKVADSIAAYQREQQRVLMSESIERLMDMLYESTTDEAKRVGLLAEWLKSPLGLQRLKALQIVYDALRGKGTKPANEVLVQIRLMLNDSDEQVRQRVIAMLRDLGLPEDAGSIRALLGSERAAAVREEIYKALGKLTDPASIDSCIAGLGEPEERVAAAAADALGRLCEKGSGRSAEKVVIAVKAILQRVARPVDSVLLRRDLVEAMADIADPAFTPLVVKHASADEVEPTIRQAALRGLERIGDPVCLEVIVDHLVTDPDAGVREVAAAAVGRFGNQLSHLQALRTRLDRATETAPTVASAAWDAYMQVFQRVAAEDQMTALSSWNSSAPDRLVLLAAAVKPEIRPEVARRILEYVDKLNETDHAAAVAFLEQLTKTVPDLFGPQWAPKFEAIRKKPPRPTSQPGSRPASQPGS